MNPPPLSNLRCWTDHGGHPFYVLAPRKVEKLWDSPDVYQFYDVLNLQWIEKVKILAAPVPEIGESAMDFTCNTKYIRLFSVLGMKLQAAIRLKKIH